MPPEIQQLLSACPAHVSERCCKDASAAYFHVVCTKNSFI